MTKRSLVFGTLILALVVLVRLFGPKVKNVDWEKRFERMPDNAPPKWMFSNIAAIRENTDRILELVEDEPTRDRAEPMEEVAPV